MLSKEMKVATRLARDAGATILKHFHKGFEIEEKSNTEYSEPVTIADRESSQIIVHGLAAAFPDDAILSEEEVDDVARRLESQRVWIIDPLDGTKGFTELKKDFAVQIALVIDGKPELGIVFQPLGDVFYSAITGEGAHMSVEDSVPIELLVSDKTDFATMTMAVSRSHRSSKMGRVFKHFGIEKEYPHGSVGLKVGFLAQQIADIYIHMSPYTKFWDSAAPQIILEEAGGKMTDIFGEPIDYTLSDVRNHNGIFSTNGVSHASAIEKLRPLLTEFGRLKVISANEK